MIAEWVSAVSMVEGRKISASRTLLASKVSKNVVLPLSYSQGSQFHPDVSWHQDLYTIACISKFDALTYYFD